MDSNGALFGYASTDTIGSFDLFGPHSTQPWSPKLELIAECLLAAMFDRDAVVIAEENRVMCVPYDAEKTIKLTPRLDNQFSKRLAESRKFACRQYSGRLSRRRINTVRVRASLP
jgi:hypothetical protein